MSDKKPTPKKQMTAPNPKEGKDAAAPQDEKNGFKDLGLPEPTRYGDWDVKGRCSDF